MNNQASLYNTTEYLLTIVERSLSTFEPHVGPRGNSSLFQGAYDWHSCVHAHWARLSIGRVLGIEIAQPTQEFVRDLIDEAELLHSPNHRKFEWPYGWAWYALLLSETERLRPNESEEVAQTKLKLFDELLVWIHGKQVENHGRSSGRHSSWLFPLFLLCLVASDDDSLRLKGRLRLGEKKQADNSETLHDFFHCPSVELLIRHFTSEERTPLLASPYLPLNLPFAQPEYHDLGLRITSVWPLAVSAAEGNTTASESFDAWLKELMTHHSQWDSTFDRLSHWIPQFIWMAIYLRLGRP